MNECSLMSQLYHQNWVWAWRRYLYLWNRFHPFRKWDGNSEWNIMKWNMEEV